MALLAQALWHDHPQHYHFLDTRRMRFSRHDLPTINGFLASYRGTDGLKTGTTCDAGYNLIASAERDRLRLMQSYREIATPLRAALAWSRCSTGISAAVGCIGDHKACGPDSAYWAIPSSAKSIARRSATLCHGASLYPPIARNKRLISIQITRLTSFAHIALDRWPPILRH